MNWFRNLDLPEMERMNKKFFRYVEDKKSFGAGGNE